ncbi:MAG: TetR/AcrR family transcriptional regulator [Ilumatobacter sp.]|uniref:TetR/AcrR family transcriptional regulator n=1 Tax=Ilumatobacter sp. TaxID=1967498 RepID=UPI003C76E323
MSSTSDDLSALAGRSPSTRSDTKRTSERLIEALNQWVAEHGAPPERLADVARLAGVSTATAYRHFASVDDAIRAFVLQLPIRAAELFAESSGTDSTPIEAFASWNLAWVRACEEHGELAVHLRSPAGFLQRRDEGEPVISFACAQIEPLLERLDGDTTMMLFMWNVTSDPREVLDLRRLGWNTEQIADFVTRAVLATPHV